MATSESKGRFFLQNESIRIDSHNESNRIDSNRELECSSVDSNSLPSSWNKSPLSPTDPRDAVRHAHRVANKAGRVGIDGRLSNQVDNACVGSRAMEKAVNG